MIVIRTGSNWDSIPLRYTVHTKHQLFNEANLYFCIKLDFHWIQCGCGCGGGGVGHHCDFYCTFVCVNWSAMLKFQLASYSFQFFDVYFFFCFSFCEHTCRLRSTRTCYYRWCKTNKGDFRFCADAMWHHHRNNSVYKTLKTTSSERKLQSHVEQIKIALVRRNS